ncbi:unnamed protein product [Brassicogethes aeneus]|uniref:Uncharacterized protein n=1 Tax=Brassicogethes aeneus TaxID=1431903 RepID=A0A9P0ATT8_BRAAE|nr:unnamed protein product [Brassicogethes aeneus]
MAKPWTKWIDECQLALSKVKRNSMVNRLGKNISWKSYCSDVEILRQNNLTNVNGGTRDPQLALGLCQRHSEVSIGRMDSEHVQHIETERNIPSTATDDLGDSSTKVWRAARVVFIPKAGKKHYSIEKFLRPIGLRSFMFKTLKRIVDRYLKEGVLKKHI